MAALLPSPILPLLTPRTTRAYPLPPVPIPSSSTVWEELMRLLASLLVFLVASVVAAGTHPFSVHDMIAMDRISDPKVSPDGTRVVFTVSVLDLPANKRRNDL